MLEAKKYNRNRIFIFVVFTIATLLMCIYATLHYLSLGLDIIDFNSYYTKEVADTVVGILSISSFNGWPANYFYHH